MIYFPTLNSLKLTESGSLGASGISDFRNTLYQDLANGVNQNFVNDDVVSGVIFKNFENIVTQVIVDVDSGSGDIDIDIINSNNEQVSLGVLDAPLNGASSELVLDNGTHQFWNFTIPTSVIKGYCSLSVYDNAEDDQFYSETFYISDKLKDSELSHDIMTLKYKNENGYEKDYYWTDGDYQEIKLDLAYNSKFQVETESESAEGIDSSELLQSESRIIKERTLIDFPEYLYEKVVKASYCTDIYLNGNAVVCTGVSDPTNQIDGKSVVTFTYKEKQTTNIY